MGGGEGGGFDRTQSFLQMGLILSLESKLETRFLIQLLLCLVGVADSLLQGNFINLAPHHQASLGGQLPTCTLALKQVLFIASFDM